MLDIGMRKVCTGDGQFTPYRPWSEERKAAARADAGSMTQEQIDRLLYLADKHGIPLQCQISARKPPPLSEIEEKSLRWFLERGATAFLDVDDKPPFVVFPSIRMRDVLLKRGLLERHERTGIYEYEISTAGRAALRA